MKLRYESPLMMIELFSVNRAIAACEAKSVVFDCMKGSTTDTTSVLADGNCKYIAKLSGFRVATNKSGTNGHSNNSGGTWSSDGKTYTAPNGAEGLLVICSTSQGFSTDHWDDSTDGLYHDETGKAECYHAQLAPVYNASDVVVGS